MAESEEKKITITKKFIVLVSLCLAGIVILSFFCGFFVQRLIYGNKANSIAWLINLIEDQYYYDEGEGVIKGFETEDYAHSIVSLLLDKYSRYYTKEEHVDVVNTNKGNSFGTGMTFLVNDDTTVVYRAIGNSPAQKAGIMAGDTLLSAKLGDSETVFTSKTIMTDFLSSVPENEYFTLTVNRQGETKTITLKKSVFIQSYVIYKDNEKTLKFQSEGASPLQNRVYEEGDGALANDIAYISLDGFEGGAGDQIGRALLYMQSRGKTKLILDLCGNGGGQMTVLSEVASYLTYDDNDKKPVIAISENKNGKKEYYRSNGDKFNRQIQKIVVLANNMTASASECLIGAMLYYGKAFSIDNLVIPKANGEARTYGKGIMQTTYKNFWTGEALKLTTALVYQPDGKTSIHGKGIGAISENSTQDYDGALARAIEILAS